MVFFDYTFLKLHAEAGAQGNETGAIHRWEIDGRNVSMCFQPLPSDARRWLIGFDARGLAVTREQPFMPELSSRYPIKNAEDCATAAELLGYPFSADRGNLALGCFLRDKEVFWTRGSWTGQEVSMAYSWKRYYCPPSCEERVSQIENRIRFR